MMGTSLHWMSDGPPLLMLEEANKLQARLAEHDGHTQCGFMLSSDAR
jgi:hypothetical protein